MKPKVGPIAAYRRRKESKTEEKMKRGQEKSESMRTECKNSKDGLAEVAAEWSILANRKSPHE